MNAESLSRLTEDSIVCVKFVRVYVVIVGSKTCRPHVITRYLPINAARVCKSDEFVDCINAVYDAELRRTKFYKFVGTGMVICPCMPNLGFSPDWQRAHTYADKLYRVMQHHTELHYPTDVVSKYKYTGKHTYCQARKGLWTRHFPTWKCLLALTALRDAAESMPLQLEFRDDTCMNCTHLDCPYAGRTDVIRCEDFRE